MVATLHCHLRGVLAVVLRWGNKTRAPSLLQNSSRWAGWFDGKIKESRAGWQAAARSAVLVCCLPFYSVLYHLLSVSVNDCVLRPWLFIKLALNYNMIIIFGATCSCAEGRLKLLYSRNITGTTESCLCNVYIRLSSINHYMLLWFKYQNNKM